MDVGVSIETYLPGLVRGASIDARFLGAGLWLCSVAHGGNPGQHDTHPSVALLRIRICGTHARR